MNKLKFSSIAFLSLFITFAINAQDIQQAKKAIDAEQYEKAKSMLKSITQSNSADGHATFLLGNIYLRQNVTDSAKIYFQKGVGASSNANLNYIGLGQMDLDNGNLAAAQANFANATKNLKKKDVEPYVYVAQAYLNADKPDYKNAIAVLQKAQAINAQDAQMQLVLGDAYYGNKQQNEAYSAYRSALTADPGLIRAKMQQGVLLKGARAFTEAVKAYDAVIATNPNYGPVYRELAETYYLWGNQDPKNYTANIQKALGFYEKYMSLTDYSLASRMRHADFLVLAKDYKALEVEAEKMKQLDKVNPRILRYLGYSAYENGNTDVALKSLQDFISNPGNKVIARDHLYLGLSKLRKANAAGAAVDAAMFDSGVADIRKAVDMEITMTNDLSETGKKFYEQKLFKEAAAIYEIAVSNPDSKNHLLDNFYLGNSIYYDNSRREAAQRDAVALRKADAAFGKVIEGAPTTQDAYIFRARTNSMLDDDAQMAKFYEDYIRIVTEKGAEEVTKNKAKIVESYNNIAASYANTDVTKARDYLNRSLALDPTNEYATDALKKLK
ncbi:MAG TPA: tetratricopeptide repeat protein [Flavobacterium sp.]|jgi:Flp pilus assembly protein TadD